VTSLLSFLFRYCAYLSNISGTSLDPIHDPIDHGPCLFHYPLIVGSTLNTAYICAVLLPDAHTFLRGLPGPQAEHEVQCTSMQLEEESLRLADEAAEGLEVAA
jgi:hypothetical protein